MFINNFLINPLEQFYFFSTYIVCIGSFNIYWFPYYLLFFLIGMDLLLNYDKKVTKISFLKLNLAYFSLIIISYIWLCSIVIGLIFITFILANIYINFYKLFIIYIIYFFNNIVLFFKNLFFDNLQIKHNIFFILFLIIFFYLIIFNFSGMLPFSFTYTSHFSFTFFISFSYFIGLNIIAYIYNNSNYFNLFLPSGVPEFIIPLITFVEFMSFFTRMFSLSIRLFANMMAGHTLLKILSFFLYSMLFSLNIFPSILFGILFLTFIIIFVITLEICISFLQSYVFITLMILYLNDIFYIH